MKNTDRISICLLVGRALAIGMFAAPYRSSRRMDLDYQNAKTHNVLLLRRDDE